MPKKIIIIEDELIAAEYLKSILEKEGFQVLAVIDTGREAIAQVSALKPDLVLMDIMLKDAISGTEAAVKIFQDSPEVAIIFLSAYSDSDMLEYAIEANSYGYLMKPYKENEIINTIKIVLAHVAKEKDEDSSTIKETTKVSFSSQLYYDTQEKRVFNHGKEVKFGVIALRLIDLLCHKPNVSISLEQIYHHVWQEKKSTTTLRTLIYRIRKKCGVDFIVSVNGLGYMVKTIEDSA